MLLEIKKFLKENGINGIEILKNKPYRLLIKKIDNLYIFNYSEKSPKNIIICQEARCLILKENTWDKVYLGFKRFFNINDETSNKLVGINNEKDFLNNENIYCVEKLDGSILGLFYDDYIWRITTRSVIDGETPMSFTQLIGEEKTFKELFNEIISKKDNFFEKLNTNLVYTFEIVSPENKIITPYTKEDEDLYLTGVRNKKNNFQELPFDDLKEIAANIGVRIPKIFKINSYVNIISQINMLKNLEEGFICVDYSKHYDSLNYSRLKIKSPRYLLEVNNKKLSIYDLTSLVIFEKDDDYKSIFPESTNILDNIKNKYIKFLDDVENEFNKFKQYKIRKEFSKHTSRNKYRGLLFCMYEGLSVKEAIFNNLKRKKSEKSISKMLYDNKWIKKD